MIKKRISTLNPLMYSMRVIFAVHSACRAMSPFQLKKKKEKRQHYDSHTNDSLGSSNTRQASSVVTGCQRRCQTIQRQRGSEEAFLSSLPSSTFSLSARSKYSISFSPLGCCLPEMETFRHFHQHWPDETKRNGKQPKWEAGLPSAPVAALECSVSQLQIQNACVVFNTG